MDIENNFRKFLVSKAKAGKEINKNSSVFGSNLTPVVRSLLQKLYIDLHNLLESDGSLPKIKREDQ